VVKVVEVGGNQKAISGGMGRVFPLFYHELKKNKKYTLDSRISRI
jgi:hypothetical protein